MAVKRSATSERNAMRAMLILALVTVGCGRGPVPADPEVGRRVADTFLAQVESGKLNEAWESTTAEFKSDEGRESFIREVKSKSQLRGPLNFVSYEVTELNGLKRGQCTYHSDAGKAPVLRVRIVVAQDAGEWRVDGLFIDNPT